jgi:hypothetical protein
MDVSKVRVTRLSEVIANTTSAEILSVVKLSHESNKADATFCFTDTCKDCGCNNDCSCDIECRRDCRSDCKSDCGCDLDGKHYDACPGEASGYK